MNLHGIPKITKQVNDWEKNYAIPFRQKSMQRIQNELENVEVLQLPNTTHMSIGVYKVDSLATLIDRFLSTGP